jgi:hypothetical protein
MPPGEPGARRIEITPEELAALLSGIDLSAATRHKRYRRAQREAQNILTFSQGVCDMKVAVNPPALPSSSQIYR